MCAIVLTRLDGGYEMGTHIDDNLAVYATCISNAFLDKYMADANGDYIKVYLYLLRHKGERFDVKTAADALNLTDNDIERAVKYWEKQGVFSDGAGKALQRAEVEARAEAIAAGKPAVNPEEVEHRLEGTLEEVAEDEEFAGIVFVAKHLLPNLPTRKQVETLEFMYRDLKMNAELIEFLMEYCAGLEKTTSKYLERVAIDWHEQGIASVKDAKKMIREFEAKKAMAKKSSKPNKFHNFETAEVDYDAIALSKVRDRMKNGAE